MRWSSLHHIEKTQISREVMFSRFYGISRLYFSYICDEIVDPYQGTLENTKRGTLVKILSLQEAGT